MENNDFKSIWITTYLYVEGEPIVYWAGKGVLYSDNYISAYDGHEIPKDDEFYLTTYEILEE